LDRLAAILATEWRAYFRRLFRTGSGAKNNLVILGVVSLLAAGRYIQFLRTAEGTQLQILFVAIFFVIASSLRNDGPLTAEALQRFPLTDRERMAIRVFSALVPPFSWLVLIFSCGVFWPLSKLGVLPMLGGVAVIVGGIAASQIPIPIPRLQIRSKTMSLFRKEIRYVLGLPEHAIVLLITLAFCIYLIGGEGLQADALRAVLGILSMLSVGFPMNAFGLDGGPGLDRYALSPVSGSHIIGTKNLAFFSVVAVQRLPILALALWRFGAAEAMWALVETASLTLLVLAWGNIVSVRHPTGPDMEPTILDGLVSTATALLPCAAAIVILRSGELVALRMTGMLTMCGLFYFGSLRFSGPHFTRHFDRVRALLVG
jgi:hypothetical protein